MVNLGRNPQLLLDVIGNFWYLSPLHSKCSTIKNKCSRTQRPHTVLAGRDSSGCFWTLQAQPYPWLFAEVVAANAAIALQAWLAGIWDDIRRWDLKVHDWMIFDVEIWRFMTRWYQTLRFEGSWVNWRMISHVRLEGSWLILLWPQVMRRRITDPHKHNVLQTTCAEMSARWQPKKKQVRWIRLESYVYIYNYIYIIIYIYTHTPNYIYIYMFVIVYLAHLDLCSARNGGK